MYEEDPLGDLPPALVEASAQIQAAIAGIDEGSDAQKAEVHLATALSAVRELSALHGTVAAPALESVADVIAAFRARITPRP